MAPELAHGLMRVLIEESCRVQELGHYSAYSGEAETVAVLGGAGRMGSWLGRFLATQGHRVRIVDPAAAANGTEGASLADALWDATLAFVATPLEGVGDRIDEIVGSGFHGVVCDIASVKGHLGGAIARARAAGVGITSLHPMFGPDVRTLSDRVIVVCDCGDAAATARVSALFGETAATLVPLSLERHDEIASYVLGLSHLINLVFARVLAGSGFSHDELAAVGSTTFQAQMTTTTDVVGESPELYYSIQSLNPRNREVYAALARTVEEWAGWVDRSEPGEFARAMQAAAAWVERRG